MIQKKAIGLFHYSLRLKGFLFLGNSESIGEFNELFDVKDKKWKLFSKKGILLSNINLHVYKTPVNENLTAKDKIMTLPKKSKPEFRDLIDSILIEEYAPPCVIINSDFNVLYIYGKTGKFLEPAPGEASLNILKMIKDGMKHELSSGVRKVHTSETAVRYDGLRVKYNGGTVSANLIIQPLKKEEYFKGLILVVFEELHEIKSTEKDINHKGVSLTVEKGKISELEREIKLKDEHLQSTVEEMETANEELKSTNEELQSANEELQSTNEELETSKEELQSVNEELVTVNTELLKKIDELSRISNDMNNLLAGTGIATIFVDHDLKIQRFTPTATQIINLISTDVGRPLSDIVSRFINYRTLENDVNSVLTDLIPKEEEVQTKEGKWYLMRIQPYRTLENVIEGAVITFVNITEQKEIRETLKAAEEKLRELENNKRN